MLKYKNFYTGKELCDWVNQFSIRIVSVCIMGTIFYVFYYE